MIVKNKRGRPVCSVTNENAGSVLGNLIRRRRHELNKSLYQVAKKAKFSLYYLSLVETGHRTFKANDLQRLAKALDMNVELLYVAKFADTTTDTKIVNSAKNLTDFDAEFFKAS